MLERNKNVFENLVPFSALVWGLLFEASQEWSKGLEAES